MRKFTNNTLKAFDMKMLINTTKSGYILKSIWQLDNDGPVRPITFDPTKQPAIIELPSSNQTTQPPIKSPSSYQTTQSIIKLSSSDQTKQPAINLPSSNQMIRSVSKASSCNPTKQPAISKFPSFNPIKISPISSDPTKQPATSKISPARPMKLSPISTDPTKQQVTSKFPSFDNTKRSSIPSNQTKQQIVSKPLFENIFHKPPMGLCVSNNKIIQDQIVTRPEIIGVPVRKRCPAIAILNNQLKLVSVQ